MTQAERKPLFERLQKSLEEGIEHAKGEKELKTIEMPEDPPEIDGKTIAAIRKQANMSQRIFAQLLSVSPKTLQSWEQGLRDPSSSVRRLIQVFAENPEPFCRSAGISGAAVEGIRVRRKKSGKGQTLLVRKMISKSKKPDEIVKQEQN